MGIPRDADARLYYRCAVQRFDDARALLAADRTTGGVYLAGYGIECILKALILEGLAPSRRSEVRERFRGAWAHDYERLRSIYYLEVKGPRFPIEVTEAFTLARDWSSELRYAPRTWTYPDASAFMAAAGVIIGWADGRM